MQNNMIQGNVKLKASIINSIYKKYIKMVKKSKQ